MVFVNKHKKKRPGRVVDSRSIVCDFKFNASNKGVTFTVGPMEWNVYCYFDKGKPNMIKKTKKSSTPRGVNEAIDYLHVKLTCCSKFKHDYTATTIGWVRMLPYASQKTAAPNHHYKQRLEKDFVKTSSSKTFYNLCPRSVVENDYTRDNIFRISVFITITRIDCDRMSDFNFKRMGEYIKTIHSDFKFIIERNDKTYTYELNQQYVSMYSEILKTKIQEFKKNHPNSSNLVINITGVAEPHEMREFLSIIYPSEREIRGKNLAESFALAKQFDSPALKNMCQNYIITNYRLFTNFQLLDYANKYNLPQIAAMVLKQLDTSKGAEDILIKLGRNDGKVNELLRNAIERHKNHPDRFQRYIKDDVADRMEMDKTAQGVASMGLKKAPKTKTQKQMNQMDDRRKKLEAIRKLRPKPDQAGPSTDAGPSHSEN